jgi:hypothetical protein
MKLTGDKVLDGFLSRGNIQRRESNYVSGYNAS